MPKRDSNGSWSIGGATASGLLALYAMLFFHRVLAGDCFFTLDFHLTFEPLRTVLGEAFAGGSLLWNPRLTNGAPLLANPMHAAAYPPNVLFAWLPPARTLSVLTVLHVLVGAWGARQIARRLGLSSCGALVAGLIFGFSGASASATAFTNLSWSVAWLPWLLLAVERILRGNAGWATVTGLALVAALLAVQGDAFVGGAAALGAALLALDETLRRRMEPTLTVPPGRAHGSGPIALRLSLAALLAVTLASPFLVPALRYYPSSVRAVGFTPEGTTLWSFHPLLGLDLLLPDAFGDAGASGHERFWPAALYPEKGAPLLIGFYVGGLTLALAVLGGLQRGGRRAWLLVWLALLSLLALGRHGPFHQLTAQLPLLHGLRFPMKWMLPAMLPLSLLAGSGADAAARGSRPGARVTILAVLGATAALAMLATPATDGWIATLIGGAPDAELVARCRERFLDAVMRAALPLAAAFVGLTVVERLGRRRRTGWMFAGLLALDLLVANPKLAPSVPAKFYDTVPTAVASIRADRDVGRVYVAPPPDDLRITLHDPSLAELSRWQRDTLQGYTAAAYGLDVAFNVDIEDFGTRTYKQLELLVKSAPPREQWMLLGAAGVTHVVTFERLDLPFAEPHAAIPLRADRPQRIYRNRLALPRVRFVPTLLPYDGEAGFVRAVERGPIDLFRRTALVEITTLEAAGLDPAKLPAFDATTPLEEVHVDAPRGDGAALRLDVTSSGGFLVISDTLVPGCTARVDGEPVPLLRVDLAFRAVPLRAGNVTLEVEYRPWTP